MREVLFLHADDNIAVCLGDVVVGHVISQDDHEIIAVGAIPRGHKIATRFIEKGAGIIKYGERMGHATTDIAKGAHVHTHNVLGDRLSTEQA
ncbi:unannotated protein [freshwater metagenome]|uniref:Unannotated protein n=1 Tax=freshwater metagenome TaxID=449393 RepID=A0A6J7M9K8_9ZZZZ|nr:UxaA family hydrolase [Actinomycetota bacterium]MSV64408.1 hydrolase [Actinomycetota bacterium]MSW26286.1 hydrolase [Actinomycetota bacterium]MSW34603.1 hydrolase [Actinomycetota bacterium]MSX31629.1 hydrolase [Actinomycetota bacterium]